jgi:HK97 family phage major capsid protein
VPQQWADEIYALTFSGGPDLLGMMTKYNMTNRVEHVPVWNITAGNTGVTAGWVSEGSVITDTTGLTNEVQLTLQKLAAMVNFTDELLRFSSPYNVEAFVKQHVPAKMRFAINDGVLNGTGSQVNLIGNAATVTVTRATSGHITFPDIVGMWTRLYSEFHDESVWLINPSCYSELLKLAFPNSSGTVPAYMPVGDNWTGGTGHMAYKPSGMLFNRPVYMVENCASLATTGDIILCHFPSIAVGYTDIDGQETNALYFGKAINSLRFLQYVATKNQVLTPYVRADSTTASNIVVLSTL